MKLPARLPARPAALPTPPCSAEPALAHAAPAPLRVIALDTETTGLSWRAGHRLVEIAAVELIDGAPTGRHFHQYLNPQRRIDPAAQRVHGLTEPFLRDKPHFEQVAQDFTQFIHGAKLVIHNAPFDSGFLNAELRRCNQPGLDHWADSIVDTVALARRVFPGQKNTLDALCQRLHIDTSARTRHGALIDAQLLAQAYLALQAHHPDPAPALPSPVPAPRYALRSARHGNGFEVRPATLDP